MQFITTGNRIAVENFVIGYFYTITMLSGNYFQACCTGIGSDFVMFSRDEPDLLFSLTIQSAADVSSIELYGGGSGTNDYNALTNKPQINSITLNGNKSLSDLGIQGTILDLDTIRSGAAAGATAVQPAAMSAALAAKQDTISDLDTIRSGAAAGATAVQPAAMSAALAAKQDTLSSAQLAAVNSGIDSTKVAQIETNKNNISKQQDTIADGGNGYAIINGQRLYMSDTAPSGDIPIGSALVSNGKVWGYKASTVANPTVLSDGTAISDYTIKGNAEQNGTPTPSNPVDAVGVGVLDNSEYIIPVLSGGTTTNVPIGTMQTTRKIKKLVLTGEEAWNRNSGNSVLYLAISDGINGNVITSMCTEYPAVANVSSYAAMTDKSICIKSDGSAIWIRDTDISSVTEFKTHLAQQYANGTPVIIYYVLATPETTTLNEPLMGIGDYTDSITGTQSQVSIPTTAGENAITFGTTVQPSEFDITAWV